MDEDLMKRCTDAMTFTEEFVTASLGECPNNLLKLLNAQRFHAMVSFEYGAMKEAGWLCKLTPDHARRAVEDLHAAGAVRYLGDHTASGYRLTGVGTTTCER